MAIDAPKGHTLFQHSLFQHILVPTDGSPLLQCNVTRAASYAKETGSRITVFFAQPEPPSAYAGLRAVGCAQLTQDIQTRPNEAARDILDAAEALVRDVGTTCQRLVRLGRLGNKPNVLIMQAAQSHGCDLIFMVSHGRQGVSALLLGCEIQKVRTHATVPVLVCR